MSIIKKILLGLGGLLLLTIILDFGFLCTSLKFSLSTDAAFQPALSLGVVHFPGTALPGEVGNCYIFGHSSDFFWKPGNFKNVFALLPRIKKGAAIITTNAEGIRFVYTVTNTFVVAPKDVWVLNQNTGGKKILTLQTSYPLGTALKRFIVVAEISE